MRRSLPTRDQLLMRIGAAKTEAGRAFGFVTIQVPDERQPVTRESFHFRVDKSKLKEAELRDGHYLLRSNLTSGDPAVLWTRYVQLTQIESVFRSLKSELGIRPIYHQLEHRVDAHILIAFLAYCLQVTLKNRLMMYAPGLTPAAVMEKLAAIQMIDVHIPTVDGRWLILPRYTQPEAEARLVLDKLKLVQIDPHEVDMDAVFERAGLLPVKVENELPVELAGRKDRVRIFEFLEEKHLVAIQIGTGLEADMKRRVAIRPAVEKVCRGGRVVRPIGQDRVKLAAMFQERHCLEGRVGGLDYRSHAEFCGRSGDPHHVGSNPPVHQTGQQATQRPGA